MGHLFPKMAFPIGVPGASSSTTAWACPISQPKRHLDQFSRFFAQITTECPYTLQWAVPFPLKIPPSHGGYEQWAAIFPPQNFPFPWGMWTPSNTWFLGPTQVLNPNGISISSAILQGSLLSQIDRQTTLLGL